jgi:DNA-binding response OmpR family regulator
MKVLLVDDDIGFLDVITYALRREGFNILTATDGVRGYYRWQSEHPDVVVANIEIPKMNGYELCRKVRHNSPTPVILVSSLPDEARALQAFRMGADDYVTKPFDLQQLAMRIRAVTRRGMRMASQSEQQEIQIGELVLDIESHEVRNGTWTSRLTPIEFRLLYLLASNPGRVVSSTRLVEYAWGYEEQDVSLLKTHMCHLRRKLSLPRGGPGDIIAIPSVGYRLNVPAAQPQEQLVTPRSSSA